MFNFPTEINIIYIIHRFLLNFSKQVHTIGDLKNKKLYLLI